MANTLETIYTKRHGQSNRERGFSILESSRGAILKETVGIGKEVLDIGCRDGTLTKYFAKSNSVLGVDIDYSALLEAQKTLGIHVRTMDLNGNWMELSNQKFNVVVAGEVLEHLYYPESVMEKVERHLEKGGMFIGSVPNAFSLKNRIRLFFGKKRFTSLGDPTHINHFHIKELSQKLQKHFSKVEIIGLGRYSGLARAFPGLFAFDLFFVCTK